MRNGLLLALLFAAAACDGATSHVYGGDKLDTKGCLDPYSAIDVIDGPSTGQSCAPVCIVDPSGPFTYASTDCAPYPVGFDQSGTAASCATALAALARKDFCLVDGGSSNPLDAAPE